MKALKDFFSPADPKPKKRNFYKITGEASFKIEVNVAGNPPYSNCVLSVISRQNSAHKLVIGSKCDWFRSYFKQDIPMTGSGNTYRVSALDIGSTIKVKVTATEPGEVGEAIVEFGPILMEPAQKNTLKNIIKSGGAKFDFESISAFDIEEGMHSGSVVVFQNNIKFNLFNSHKDFRIYFGERFEMIQGKDDKTLIFRFGDSVKINAIKEYFSLPESQQSNQIKIKLVSQISRDNLIIAVRSFEEMIDLKDSLLLEKTLASLTDRPEQKRLAVSLDDISTQLDNTSLQRELWLLNEAHATVCNENQKLTIMVNNLDGEISRSQFCSLYL